MAIPDIDADYAKYLASNKESNIRTITTIEIYHVDESAGSDTFRHYFCNGREDFTAKTDSTVYHTFSAVPISFGKTSVKNTTEQRRTVTLDGLEGTVYAAAKALTAAQRIDPVRVTVRTYRSNRTAGPAIMPPPEYIVSKATADAGRVTLELTSVYARQRRCGQYATIDKYPGLAHL